MNLKRAIWVGVLTYVLSFIIAFVVMIAMGVEMSPGADMPDSVYITGIVITIIVAIFFTLLYFKDKRIAVNAKEGLYFGLVLIILGAIMDIVMFSLGSLAGQNTMADMVTYYSNPLFWVAMVSFVVTTMLVGYFKGKKASKLQA